MEGEFVLSRAIFWVTYADSYQRAELVITATVSLQGLLIFQITGIQLSYSLTESIPNS